MIALSISTIVKALKADFQGEDIDFKGISINSRMAMQGQLFVALRGDNFDAHQFIEQAEQQGAIALLVETFVESDLPQIRVLNTRQALLDIGAFWRKQMDLSVIAITGSNGKTSVKELLRCILVSAVGKQAVHATAGNLNNDIGVPLTLFGLNQQHRYAVIEMGANHLQEIASLTKACRPDVAVITLCAAAHLAGFGSKDGVAQAKGEIFLGLNATGVAIINADDQYADYWRDLNTKHTINYFGLDKKADVYAEQIQLSVNASCWLLCTPKGKRKIKLPLAGLHNIKNALAATACALALDCDLEAIVLGLSQIKAPAGRLQSLQLGERLIWDDSYNANPSSVQAGIDVLAYAPAPRYLILGDLSELGADIKQWHQQLGHYAQQAGIEGLYTVGEYSLYSSQAFGDAAQHFDTMTALQGHLQQHLPRKASLLIKGSRSAGMERVMRALQTD